MLDIILESYKNPKILETTDKEVVIKVALIDSILDSEYIHTKIITQAFLNINLQSSSRQDMELAELEQDISSSDVIKFFATVNDVPIAILTVHTSLETVAWIDKSYKKYLEDSFSGYQFFYIGTLVVDPSAKEFDRIGTRVLKNALNEFANFIDNNKSMAALFDCAQANIPFIPSLVDGIISNIKKDGRLSGHSLREIVAQGTEYKHVQFSAQNNHNTAQQHHYIIV